MNSGNQSASAKVTQDFLKESDKASRHWSYAVATKVLERFPNAPVYTCAAGISPSGIVHFGNFRDVMTSFLVLSALREFGKPVRFLFSWDDFDRLRKVPKGVSESFSEFIGKPLSDVPDPDEKHPSYARRFEAEFEEAMAELQIPLEYKYQTDEYRSGRYDDEIVRSLQSREQIADVLLSCMSNKGKADKGVDENKYREEYYPLSVYSRFSGKDNTKVIGYDGLSTITYFCRDTQQQETVNLREHRIAKLAWKVDWPMRWGMESVVFEPGGKDHASPGGSYDVSKVIAEKVFQRPPPVFQGYEFIGIQGLSGKMSGSKGDAVSPSDLLEIYEPELLRWLYTRKLPTQAFMLAFDTEILRQYDEFDRERVAAINADVTVQGSEAIRIAFGGKEILPPSGKPPIPFKQAVALGQTVQWNPDKVNDLLEGLEQAADLDSIVIRLKKARAWLETYNPDQVLSLLPSRNDTYLNLMSDKSRRLVRELRDHLKSGTLQDIKTLETTLYGLPKDPALEGKENSVLQRAFFKDLYQLLLGKETGPRLSTFLWAVDRRKVEDLLAIS